MAVNSLTQARRIQMPERISKIPEDTWFSRVVAVKGHPAFLQRNVNKITAQLENSLDQKSDCKVRLNRLAWKPPVDNVIDAIMAHKTKRDKLRIDITGLKPNKQRSNVDSHEPTGAARKKCRLLDLKCFLQVLIFPVTDNCQEDVLVLRQVECDLTGRQYSDGEAHFDIGLVQPIILSSVDLETEIKSGGKWTRGFGSHYRVNLKLSFQDPEESKRILSWVGAEGGQVSEPVRLSATWENLIKCPPRGAIIPIQLKTYSSMTLPQSKLNYGFEVNMGWQSQAVESVIQVHNNAQRRVLAKTQTKAPPPEAPQLQPDRVLPLSLEYRCGDRYVPYSGLHCIICRRKNFVTPASLQFHIRSSHQLSVTMTESPELVQIVFQEPPQSSDQGYNWSWANISLVTPPMPVLRKKFLSGEEEVKKPGPRIKFVKKGAAKDREKQNGVESPAEFQLEPDLPKKKVDISLELDYSKRKKFQRPNSPGRSESGKQLLYYTVLAKRPISEGEMLEESDDDVDVEFAVQASGAILKSTEEDEDTVLPKDADRFLRIWNRHLIQEHLYSDRFLGVSIVRFIGKEKCLFRRDEAMRRCLRLRMKDLLEAGAISKPKFDTCLMTLQTTCGKTIKDATDHQQAVVRRYGSCECGGLYSSREASDWASCSNHGCAFPLYHLKCVGLEDVDCPPGWRCKPCMR